MSNIKSLFKYNTDDFKAWAQKVSLPGFDKVPIYYVVKFFLSGAKNGYLATRASAIAFHFALAIFPSMLFIFTLIPFIPVKDLQVELLTLIQNFLPQTAYQFFENTLISVVTVKKIGAFSFGG